jgi:UDP-N-acetylmuramoylalanine--D-glutamate ligase
LPRSAALAGRHGARNALAALAAASFAGANLETIERGLDRFRGVKDRMETVAEIDGVTYINDTTATAPIAAVAALETMATAGRRVHLLAGGANKRLDPSPLADAAERYGAAVYLFAGTATEALDRSLRDRGVVPHGVYSRMEDAIAAARHYAGPGDVVLLSPGCASFGLFRDEFDRGEQFRQVVMALRAERGDRARAV